ncbi:MAG: hypothetical protein ACRENP_18265 [Longimicrobiales bacterium]
MMKSMVRPMTVVTSTRPEAPLPTADVVLQLSDYDFTISAPIQAGTRTIRVENAGEQPHELVVIQLEPGKTVEEAAQCTAC